MKWINIKDELPTKTGHYLVSGDKYPKNYPAVVAEYYTDNNMFYDEDTETPLKNAEYWCELNLPPNAIKENYTDFWDTYKDQ